MSNFKIFKGKQFLYFDTYMTKSEAIIEERKIKSMGFDTKIERVNNGFTLWRSVNKKKGKSNMKSDGIRKIAIKIKSYGLDKKDEYFLKKIEHELSLISKEFSNWKPISDIPRNSAEIYIDKAINEINDLIKIK